ncbi:MAG TPA: ATP-binding protein [Gemmatimonadales bacterium]
MNTLRQRLTVWYTAALAATVLVFGASLYVDRRITSSREVDQRLMLEAALSTGWLTESERVLGRVVTLDEERPALDPGIAAYFEGFRDYLIVTDPHGRPLFLSAETRALPAASTERLLGRLRNPPASRQQGTLTFDESVGPVRFLAQPVPGAGDQVGGLLVAASVGSVFFGPGALLRSMVLSLPILLVASVLIGYWLAGTALRPMEPMIAELEAITDGRSLHRRLEVPRTSDELARLASAVNRMFARLEQSFSALHRFIADASHELKTPLMVLRAGVERTLTHPRNPPENLEALDATLAEIHRMTELVENLLTLARADEGRAPLAVAPCDLREPLAEAAETAGILAEGKGITVTTRMPPDPVELAVDRSRIRQLLLNLTTNAVKYTPSQGAIHLELDDRRDRVVIQVRDTGVGIAAGDLPHVFDRFWRGDPARSRTGAPPGTGLGLAITQWIAEAHGGQIEVQSRPGRGSTFTVVLPRSPGSVPVDANS